MKLLRYQEKRGQASYGWLDGDRVGRIQGSPFADFRRLEPEIAFDKIQLLPPVVPGKIIGIGRNYAAHAREQEAEVPTTPILFLKPSSAVIGPGHVIELPVQSERVEYEGELVIVIGKPGRWITPGDAAEHILGYTIGNDVTARDLQRKDNQWTRGKSFDTFCPIGPFIETEIDPFDLVISTHVNRQLKQMASTRDMIFSINQLVAFISSIMTLDAGDIILTGTPEGVGVLRDGDSVSITIEGIGTLSNSVRRGLVEAY